ncbi:T-cell-specific guanine nucleotide triphosphate-binding protein 2-like isoform X2 [Mercenaria mercenaria]|uniref:T-cell-specific guanine nucleotide triphosphate-binding protein 2-like isoform X2 n=1 Tax=Mercenaria mercenaria TaxID=6596 RepID=UPI00234F5F52|nr:T-cell-specific guanine nucleotide triphosphate-binding protein 2-like isoform X2 [Mercenaria mercenaria]
MANLLPDKVDTLRKLIEEQDIIGAHGFVQESMHVFNIAVTGESGSAGRFTELDLFLALKVQEYGKVFYFVRCKIDMDLRNEQMSYPKTYNETVVLNRIREDCIKYLDSPIGKCDVFLINNYDRSKYDFPKLNRSIVKDAALVKIDFRERVLSSLVNGVYQKKREFAKSGTVPVKEAKHKVPNTPIYVDATCISEEIEHFKQEFSLNKQAIAEYAALMDMSVVDMTKNLSLRSLQMDFSENGILMACAELYPFSKISFPFFGSFLSSRSVVKVYLEKVIDQMCDDAIKLNMALISRTRNQHSESSSACV